MPKFEQTQQEQAQSLFLKLQLALGDYIRQTTPKKKGNEEETAPLNAPASHAAASAIYNHLPFNTFDKRNRLELTLRRINAGIIDNNTQTAQPFLVGGSPFKSFLEAESKKWSWKTFGKKVGVIALLIVFSIISIPAFFWGWAESAEEKTGSPNAFRLLDTPEKNLLRRLNEIEKEASALGLIGTAAAAVGSSTSEEDFDETLSAHPNEAVFLATQRALQLQGEATARRLATQTQQQQAAAATQAPSAAPALINQPQRGDTRTPAEQLQHALSLEPERVGIGGINLLLRTLFGTINIQFLRQSQLQSAVGAVNDLLQDQRQSLQQKIEAIFAEAGQRSPFIRGGSSIWLTTQTNSNSPALDVLSKFDNVKFTRNNAPDWHDYFFFIPNDAAKNRLVAFLQDGVKQQQQAASVMAPTPAPMAIAIAPVLAAPAPTTPPPAVQPQQVYMAQATAPMIGAPAAPMPTVVAVAPQQPRPVLTVFPGSTQISSDNDFSVFLNRYFSRGDEQSRLTVGKAINPGFPQQTDGFIYITVPRVNNMEEKIHDLLKQHTEFDRTGNNGTMRQDLPAQTDGSSWTCFWVLPTQASLLKQAIERELRQTTTALATTVAAPMPPLSMLRRGAAAPSTTASRSVIFPPAATSNSKDSGEAEADRQVALAAANAETARLRSLGKEATVAAEAQRAQLAAAELKNREAQAQLALTEAALAAASSSSPRR